MSSTIDVISGGRFELGIGAGWKEDEWRAYGYGFPPLAERMAALGDHLEVITEMFAAGPGDLRGPLRARPRRDQRAARAPGAAHPDHRRRQRAEDRRPATRSATPTSSTSCSSSPTRSPTGCAEVRERCEAEGRDPATLRFSLYARDEQMRDAGQARVDLLGRFAEIGLDRLVAFPTRWSPTLEAQAAFAEDCAAAGIELDGRVRSLVQGLDRLRDRLGVGLAGVRHRDDELVVAGESTRYWSTDVPAGAPCDGERRSDSGAPRRPAA